MQFRASSRAVSLRNSRICCGLAGTSVAGIHTPPRGWIGIDRGAWDLPISSEHS